MLRRPVVCSFRTIYSSSRFLAPQSSSSLVVTDRAANRLKQIIKPGEVLRVTVEGGGCSGFEYKMDLDSKITEEDEVIEKDGVKVIIDKV